MNITLSADERIISRARAYAAERGTSLNQLIRDYLEQLVGEVSAEDAAAEFVAIAREEAGNSSGTSVSRESIYEERMRKFTHHHVVAEQPQPQSRDDG